MKNLTTKGTKSTEKKLDELIISYTDDDERFPEYIRFILKQITS